MPTHHLNRAPSQKTVWGTMNISAWKWPCYSALLQTTPRGGRNLVILLTFPENPLRNPRKDEKPRDSTVMVFLGDAVQFFLAGPTTWTCSTTNRTPMSRGKKSTKFRWSLRGDTYKNLDRDTWATSRDGSNRNWIYPSICNNQKPDTICKKIAFVILNTRNQKSMIAERNEQKDFPAYWPKRVSRLWLRKGEVRGSLVDSPS